MERPLSPFMFPTWYRFQITSALSILHRLTGIALAVGSILLAWWLVAVAAGGELFAATHAFIASPIGCAVAVRLVGRLLLPPVQRHPAPRLGRRLRLRDPASAYRSGYAVLAATVAADRARLALCAFWPRRISMAKAPRLSNSTALRDETVLRRVRHLGSARDGLREWRLQRLTAIALIPLGLYFAASILWLAKSDQTTAAAWLASPVPALLVILFVLAGLTHALVGLRSVLLDYVHTRARLLAAELLVRAVRGDPRQAPACSPSSSSSSVAKGDQPCPTVTTSSTTPST